MHSAAADIEVIELDMPADATEIAVSLPVSVHPQWAAHVFHAARVQPARAVVTTCARVHGAAGARTFYWLMLALALLAFTLA